MGNWKMNTTIREAVALCRAVRRGVHDVRGVETVICPPALSLGVLADMARSSRVGLGAQNVHWESKGAFTGEISPAMLVGVCRYAIIGHSERRTLFDETDDEINRKVAAVLSNGLVPVLCVGENLSEYEAGRTVHVVGEQLRAATAGLSPQQAQRVVIAYEPIWAIGTGKPSTGAAAGSVAGLCIRGTLLTLFGAETADTVRILYGGSVTAANIEEFMIQPDIDGALVGGASLSAEGFISIVKATAQAKGGDSKHQRERI